jgi:hypothetical protein
LPGAEIKRCCVVLRQAFSVEVRVAEGLGWFLTVFLTVHRAADYLAGDY